MARRLARGGHRVVAYNRSPEKAYALAGEEPNVVAVKSLEEIATQLTPPRAAWVMVPAGEATELVVGCLDRRVHRLTDRGKDQVLQHLDVLEIYDIGRNLHFDQLGAARDHRGDHAATCRALETGLGKLGLGLGELLLHLLRLLHDLTHVGLSVHEREGTPGM